MSSASPTATEPTTRRLLREPALEHELRRAERDAVAARELRPPRPAAVDLAPVRRPEVDQPVRRALLPDLGVTARDVRIGDLDVALLAAAEDGDALRHVVRRAVERQRD